MKYLVIYPYPGIDSNPTMGLLLEKLDQQGIDVDLLIMSPSQAGPIRRNEYLNRVGIIALPYSFFQVSWNFFHRLGVRILMESKLSAFKDIGFLDPLLSRLLWIHEYDLVLGVDPYGIILADFLLFRRLMPLVYVSFEILFEDELNPSEMHIINKELAALRRCDLLLLQDEERLNAFRLSHEIANEKVCFLPVSPPPLPFSRDRYDLRKELGIPEEKRIVLFIGALETWASRDEFEEMVSYWPEQYMLVIHGRSVNDPRMSAFLSRLETTGKIKVSTRPVPPEMLPSLVSSADYGLAPYKPVPDAWWTGKNLYHLGYASGKVAYYAMAGLPVLARSLPVFEREFSDYRCGETYRFLAETGDKLMKMEESYAEYSAGSIRFYKEKLNPLEKMDHFCNKLFHLATEKRL